MLDKESARNEQITDEVFRAAVEMVQNLPKTGDVGISNTDKLEFYALFKQATIGRCNTPRPSIWSVVDRYKWYYRSIASKSVQAKDRYVHKFKTIMDQVLENRTVHELLQDERWAYLRPTIEPRFELINRALNKQPTSSNHKKTNLMCTRAPIQQPHLHYYCIWQPNRPSNRRQTKVPLCQQTTKNTKTLPTIHRLLSIQTTFCTSILLLTNCIVLRHSHGNVTPNDPIIPNKIRSDVVEYVQATTQIINQQIQALGRMLKKQNALIQRFIELMSRNRSHTRWPFLLLLFIWPIVVQLAMRYFFSKNLTTNTCTDLLINVYLSTQIRIIFIFVNYRNSVLERLFNKLDE
ncbi:Acyl CoA binding protein [Aphelenchoides besseyi]|nr:Acyl CoA binding protein [Aphelenchoides besseyi]